MPCVDVPAHLPTKWQRFVTAWSKTRSEASLSIFSIDALLQDGCEALPDPNEDSMDLATFCSPAQASNGFGTWCPKTCCPLHPGHKILSNVDTCPHACSDD